MSNPCHSLGDTVRGFAGEVVGYKGSVPLASRWLREQQANGFVTHEIFVETTGLLVTGYGPNSVSIALHFPDITCGSSETATCVAAAELLMACGFPPQTDGLVADILTRQTQMHFVPEGDHLRMHCHCSSS